MTQQEETNVNWLAMAITLPTAYIGEFCYYDRLSNSFFILTNLDHILIDSGLRSCFINSYSEEEDAFLVDKLKRLEDDSQEIITIPRISIEKRTAIQMGFMAKLEGTKYFKVLVDAVSEQDNATTFVLDKRFKDNKELSLLSDHWWNYKFRQLIDPISQFESDYSINLSTASLFHIEPNRRGMVKIKQPEPLEEAPTQGKKAWWRFW